MRYSSPVASRKRRDLPGKPRVGPQKGLPQCGFCAITGQGFPPDGRTENLRSQRRVAIVAVVQARRPVNCQGGLLCLTVLDTRFPVVECTTIPMPIAFGPLCGSADTVTVYQRQWVGQRLIIGDDDLNGEPARRVQDDRAFQIGG